MEELAVFKVATYQVIDHYTLNYTIGSWFNAIIRTSRSRDIIRASENAFSTGPLLINDEAAAALS